MFLHAPFHNDLLNLCHPREHFCCFKLTEVMQQQADSIFIDYMNNVRAEAISKIDVVLISLRSCAINNISITSRSYIFVCRNSLKNNFNNERLMKLIYH